MMKMVNPVKELLKLDDWSSAFLKKTTLKRLNTVKHAHEFKSIDQTINMLLDEYVTKKYKVRS